MNPLQQRVTDVDGVGSQLIVPLSRPWKRRRQHVGDLCQFRALFALPSPRTGRKIVAHFEPQLLAEACRAHVEGAKVDQYDGVRTSRPQLMPDLRGDPG